MVPDMDKNESYLGSYLFKGNPQKHFQNVIKSKINSRLKGWKAKTLSHAGRTTMINSTLSSMPIYSMSIAMFPKKNHKSLNASFRDFWWGFDEGKHHCYLTAWKNFLFPISRGGLGMRDMELVNIAMLLKLAWRFIIDPRALWVRVLSSKYLRYDDFWSINANSSNSDLWKSLFSIRHIMYQYSCWSIGRGDKINIWCDVWIPNFHFPITPI